MKLSPVPLAVLLLISAITLPAAAQEVRRPYIVQLAAQPVASYMGELAGLAATRPPAGQALSVAAPAAQAYVAHLDRQQQAVIATVAAAPVLHQYKLAFNGFAALLTDAEVRLLKKNKGVAAITPDVPRTPVTNYTPTFLGLDKVPNGLWNQLGGKEHAGEGVVIGLIDTGIWPENAAFADRVDANGVPTFDPAATRTYGAPPAAWTGACQFGEGFSPAHCNNKLIGARYFNAGFKASNNTPHWTEFVSPRDSLGGEFGHGGHGTHTASTAGGNNGVEASVAGIVMGAVSGMAPRARIAMYKVCWTFVDEQNPDGSGSRNACYGADSVAAIDQAVADGVNVINYSISGTQNNVLDPVEQAFLGAANAGVFVAASAGNSGPGNAVAHISPWLATVGASTHNRLNGANATTGAGVTYLGASLNQVALAASPAILARDAGVVPYASLNALDQAARRLCFSATDRAANNASDAAALARSAAEGKVVVCERGTSARVDKSRVVADVGGIGMVLADNGAGIVSEVHSVPTVHVNAADGIAIAAYVKSVAAPTLALSAFRAQPSPTPAPRMAGFSSRGPNQGYPGLLKPDMTAPGVDVLAGVSTAQSEAERDAIAAGTLVPGAAWDFYSGTSMSSPHVAGLAALLHQQHAAWSPAAIKSALMTTASPTFDDGQPGMANGQLPWAQGAGHVVPNSAADPGLVYELGARDYQRFLCGAGLAPASVCQSVGAIPAYNLNLASLTAPSVLGKQVLTRSVTNAGSTSATYAASAVLPGFEVTVVPASLTLAPGQQASFSVRLARTSAPRDEWQYGSLEWKDGSHTVTSPLTARAVLLAAPAELHSESASGNSLFTVGTGYTGKLAAASSGLKAAVRSASHIETAPPGRAGEAECLAGGQPGVNATAISIPDGALAARFALWDVDTGAYAGGHTDDLDLMVLDAAGNLVGYSGNGSSDEVITLTAPAAGNYTVCVIGYAPYGGSTDYTLSSWVLGRGETGGHLKASMPGSVFLGGTASASLNWSGLTPGLRYLGALEYSSSGATLGTTVLEVDVTDPLPTAAASRSQRAPSERKD